jgi:hypothetical protein
MDHFNGPVIPVPMAAFRSGLPGSNRMKIARHHARDVKGWPGWYSPRAWTTQPAT